MNKYNIAGIGIELKYVFPDIMTELLIPYKAIDIDISHSFVVTLIDDVCIPQEYDLVRTYRKRSVFKNCENTLIVDEDENGVFLQSIRYDTNYKHVLIQLNRKRERTILIEQEYVITGLMFMEVAILHNRLAIHASAVSYRHQGWLFSASSGTGKSTHTNHWLTEDDTFVINDDKPLLFQENKLWYVAGSPWCGKELLHNNLVVPLKAIVFLKRGTNTIQELDTQSKLIEISKNIIKPRSTELVQRVLSMIGTLVETIPMIEFRASKDSSSMKELQRYAQKHI